MRLLSLPFLTVCAAALTTAFSFADWPSFRGLNGTGVSAERGLPIHWSATENARWKTKLPGPGASSPVIFKDRVFVTCYSGYGLANQAADAKPTALRRHLLCLDRSTGRMLWQRDVPALQPEAKFSRQIGEHGYASSTPVTDGERVYVFFGRTGALAFDFEGKQLWHTELGKGLNTFGSGASPVLYKDLLLVNAAVESSALVALDKLTGKVIWKSKLDGDCWSTPLLVPVTGDKTEVVLNGPADLIGFDPENGERLWTCESPGPAYSSATPVADKGIVYVMGSGSEGRWFMAVRVGGRGDVAKTHVLWKQTKVGASYCSPTLVDGRLYYFSGLATCLKAETGETVFQERLAGLGQEYGSPTAADGKVFLFTRRKGAYVLAASDKFQVLSHNDLGDASDFNGCPAISGGCIFVRSNECLYCIGVKE
jgi:outer membrane protein assembly factor BamB